MSEGFYDERRGDSMSWDDTHSPGCFVNQWRGGLVLKSEVRDATIQGSGKPKFWPDANGEPDPTRPVKVLVVTVHAENERDPQNPADDGIRAIWIEKESLKYSKKNKNRPGQPKVGVKYGAHCDAMESAGVAQTLPLPGGYYYLLQTGTVPGEGTIPRKTWAANYQVPTAASLQLLEQVTRPSQPSQEQQSQQVFVQPPQQQLAAPEAPRWQGNGQSQSVPQTPTPPAPPAPQPAYAQAPTPPMGPQHGMYGPDGGPSPAPPQQHQAPPSPPQYAGAPY